MVSRRKFISSIIAAAGYLLINAGAVRPALSAEPAVPPALETWRQWVIERNPDAGCPRAYGDEKAAFCAFPGVLEIEAGDTGARFRQSWKVYRESLIPLPGDFRHFVTAVSAGGRPQPVVSGPKGTPAIILAAGDWQVEGEIRWPSLPLSLTVPSTVALVSLTVSGQAVSRVQWQTGGIRLGEGAAGEAERDTLEIVAGRVIDDTLPLMLETHFDLEVSGRPREVTLGPLLPAGFIPTVLESELPARLDAAGLLTLQLRSGSWSVKITARAPAPVAELARPAHTAPWPETEFWSFRPHPELRSVRLTGAAQVSPRYMALPEAMANEDAFYALPAGGQMRFEELGRGARQVRDKIAVERGVWFDFAGGGMTLRDRLTGELLSTERLDIRPPYRLTAVNEVNREVFGDHKYVQMSPQLVTRNPETGAVGVEVRNNLLYIDSIDAQIRAPASWYGVRGLPLGAWDLPLDRLEITLNLPPATRLLAASGFDRVSGDWLGAWNLGDVFIWILTVVLAWRIGGASLALPAGLWVALARHEPYAGAALLLALLLVLLLAGYARDAGQRLGLWIGWAARVLIVLLALQMVAFALPVIEAALYPQLEMRQVDQWLAARKLREAVPAQEEPMSLAAAPPAKSPARDKDGVELDRVLVIGHRRSWDYLEPYDENAVVQAGNGLPSWTWRRHTLSRNGPIAPDETQALWIAPPWLVRAWRWLMIALAVLLLAQLARRTGLRVPRFAAPAAAAPALLLLAAAGPGAPAVAAEFPPPELLQELEHRLERDPSCVPDCVTIPSARLVAGAEEALLTLEVHAAAGTVVAVPLGGENWRIHAARLDGRPAALTAGDQKLEALLAVGAGIHQVELAARLDGRNEIAIDFPERPRRIDLDLTGWIAEGVDDARLLRGTLVLYREAGADMAMTSGADIPPFVRVERQLALGTQFTVLTEIHRLAPASGAFSVRIPLLDGEQVISDPPPKIVDDQVEVTFPPGEEYANWYGRLPLVKQLTLRAPDYDRWIELWSVGAGALWHMTLDGPPLIIGDERFDDRYPPHYGFVPLPGETLTITLERPEALPGAPLAYDRVDLVTHHQGRWNLHELDAEPRPTLSGLYPLTLGAGAELLEVKYNGQPLDLALEDGVIVLPLRADENVIRDAENLHLTWRQSASRTWRVSTPVVDLHAPAANIGLKISHEGRPRWILWAGGPKLGPAVRFWSLLLGVALIALLLAKSRLAPLRFHHWLILGLGFTAVGGFGFWIVAAWLIALGWRARWSPAQSAYRSKALVQSGLALLTLIALGVLFSAIEHGLLAAPDMHIAGWRNRYDPSLSWFADRSADVLPAATVYSAPLWAYRLVMLGWSLWLALLLVRWLGFGWRAANAGGLWPRRASQSQPPNRRGTDTP